MDIITEKGKNYIYALKDPRDEQIYYIGKTNNPRARYKQHLKDSDVNKYKVAWLEELRKEELKPEMAILDTVGEDWEECETAWIEKGTRKGWPLTNIVHCRSGQINKDIEFVRRHYGEHLADRFAVADNKSGILILMAAGALAWADVTQNAFEYFDLGIPPYRKPIDTLRCLLRGEEIEGAIMKEAALIQGKIDRYLLEKHGFEPIPGST